MLFDYKSEAGILLGAVVSVVIWLGSVSCASYKMIDGRSYPVYLNPDSSVFSDPDFPKPILGYADVGVLRGNGANAIYLAPNTGSMAVINGPTLFSMFDWFLVYPREKITISRVGTNDYLFTVKNERRNHELAFFKSFYRSIIYPVIPKNDTACLFTIVKEAGLVEMRFRDLEKRAKIVSDSIFAIHHVSKRFKKMAAVVLENDRFRVLLNYYRNHADTLKAHGLLKQKYLQLVNRYQVRNNKKYSNYFLSDFNEMADEIMPVRPDKIKNLTEYKSDIRFADSVFNGDAQDYIRAKCIYSLLRRNVVMGTDEIDIHNETDKIKNKLYKGILHNMITREQALAESKEHLSSDNILVSVNRHETITFDKLINRQSGKIVVVDFWATWCVPCLKEADFLQGLSRKYSAQDVSFVSVSIDNDNQAWKKFVLANNLDKTKNFNLLDYSNASFIQQQHINSIPRYIIFDRSGKIVDAEAQLPSSGKLGNYLDSLLGK